MFIPCAVKYALCFYAGCKFYRAFFLRVLKHNYFRWFSFRPQEKMAGIENRSNYCFLSSLLHCVMNCNEIRNFLFDHYKRNTGLLNHNSKFFVYEC